MLMQFLFTSWVGLLGAILYCAASIFSKSLRTQCLFIARMLESKNLCMSNKMAESCICTDPKLPVISAI